MRENFVLLKTFTNLTEAYEAQVVLESAGIMSGLENELSVQVLHASNATAVKLLVPESQLLLAKKVLQQAKFIGPQTVRELPLILRKLDNFTKRIPLIRKWQLLPRLFTLTALLLTLIITPIVISGMPDLRERLVHAWCVDRVLYRGKVVSLPLPSVYFTRNDCSPWYIHFEQNGSVSLPCVEKGSIVSMEWSKSKNGEIFLRGIPKEVLNYDHKSGELVQVIESDSSSAFYTGTYELSLTGNYLELKSDRIRIQAHR